MYNSIESTGPDVDEAIKHEINEFGHLFGNEEEEDGDTVLAGGALDDGQLNDKHEISVQGDKMEAGVLDDSAESNDVWMVPGQADMEGAKESEVIEIIVQEDTPASEDGWTVSAQAKTEAADELEVATQGDTIASTGGWEIPVRTDTTAPDSFTEEAW